MTNRFKRMLPIYKRFATGGTFTAENAEELFLWESLGEGNLSTSVFSGGTNGFAIGKRWVDLQVAEWKKDIASRLLFKHELYADWYPHWWLDKVLTDKPYRRSD